MSFEVKIERMPLRIQKSTPCLLHTILTAWQGAGLFPTEIKQILLNGFSWKLELPLKREYSFNQYQGYTPISINFPFQATWLPSLIVKLS